jgi:hypothetical protein
LLRDVARGGNGRYASADVLGELRAVQADLGDPGPEPVLEPDSTRPVWAHYDLPFLLGALALALVLLESLLGMRLPRLRSLRAREAA